MLWKPPPVGRPRCPFTAITDRTVAPAPEPGGIAATSTIGRVIPQSFAISSIPLAWPEPPISRISILPFTVGSVALNASTIAASRPLSVTAAISSSSTLALIELCIALSATPISVQYLAAAALTSPADESIRNAVLSSISMNQSMNFTIASGVSPTIWLI
ncbi:MAG: hypothetical protein C00003105_01708 [ANME-2 cluster archaeon HR1]|nr:MAG: hypothetical protein C00003105_01708 [ANME-2 cluster archaeon HR1]